MKIMTVLLFFLVTNVSAEIYRWSDSRGTIHYSNSLDDVPPVYRTRVKSMNYGSDTKPGTPSLVPGQGSGSQDKIAPATNPVSSVEAGIQKSKTGRTHGRNNRRGSSKNMERE